MTTLLFDADLFAFKSSKNQEVAEETEDGYWTWRCNFDDVKKEFNSRVEYHMDLLNASDYRLFVSDVNNFRKTIYPSYKLFREKHKRPVVLKAFREYLLEERGGIVFPNLEGDDLCGIFATSNEIPGEKIIISEDKDLKTIPGYLFKGGEVKWYSKEQADYYHLYQTLVGDQTDGYPGAKGIGAKKAEIILQEPTWASVVKAFQDIDQTEEDALIQARCARILHAENWNFDTQEVIHWVPQQ